MHSLHRLLISDMNSVIYIQGWDITEQQLEEVAELSDVLADNDDYLPANHSVQQCEQIIADPLELDVARLRSCFSLPQG